MVHEHDRGVEAALDLAQEPQDRADLARGVTVRLEGAINTAGIVSIAAALAGRR